MWAGCGRPGLGRVWMLGQEVVALIMDRLAFLGLMMMVFPAQTLAAPAALPAEYAQSPSGKPLTEKERTALGEGKILVHLTEIPGTPVKRATAVALVDASPESVFGVLTDYDEFPSFMPYCKKAQIQKKEGEQSWVRFELDFPWPIGDRHYVLRLTDRRDEVSGKPVLASRWTYEPDSGNINDTYGSWEVFCHEGSRSFVRYTVFTDPGGNIPNWARNVATDVAVPKVIKGLRKRATEKTTTAPDASTGLRERDAGG